MKFFSTVIALACIAGSFAPLSSNEVVVDDFESRSLELILNNSFYGTGFRKFKTDNEVISQGDYTRAGEKAGFSLFDANGTLLTTSTRFKLLPSKEDVYVCRDAFQQVLGFLVVENTSIASMLKPVITTLYSAEGEPMLLSTYGWSAFGIFGSITYETRDLREEGQPIIFKTSRSWLSLKHKTLSNPNVDMKLFMSMVNMQHIKGSIADIVTKPSSKGSIHIDELSTYAQTSGQGLESLSEKSLVASGSFEDETKELADWKDLQEYLEETTALAVELTAEEIEENAIALASKLQDENGLVSPETIMKQVGSLSDKEKLVLIKLIDSRINL